MREETLINHPFSAFCKPFCPCSSSPLHFFYIISEPRTLFTYKKGSVIKLPKLAVIVGGGGWKDGTGLYKSTSFFLLFRGVRFRTNRSLSIPPLPPPLLLPPTRCSWLLRAMDGRAGEEGLRVLAVVCAQSRPWR